MPYLFSPKPRLRALGSSLKVGWPGWDEESVLVIQLFLHTNSERVPHVRTSVRGLRKLGRSPLQGLSVVFQAASITIFIEVAVGFDAIAIASTASDKGKRCETSLLRSYPSPYPSKTSRKASSWMSTDAL
jgi:hypothetical protein